MEAARTHQAGSQDELHDAGDRDEFRAEWHCVREVLHVRARRQEVRDTGNRQSARQWGW